MKKNKKKIIAIITLIIIIILGYFIYQNVSIEKTGDNNEDYQDYTPEEEISEEQLRQTKLVLYFANSETGELETEIKVVDANTLLVDPYKELVSLLIKGPQSSNLKKLIPEGTKLHDAKLEGSCVVINLSNEFLNFENEDKKLKTINSIVNTLTNLKEVDSVKFLINGEESEQLSEIYVKSK